MINVKGEKIAIIGAKKSGLSSAKMLLRLGAYPFLSDHSVVDYTTQKALDELNIDYEYGSHSNRVLDCSFAVISPGVPGTANIIRRLEEAGKRIISEIELASAFCKSKIVAITGSEGKTTTSTLLHSMLEYDGLHNGYKSCLAGNIGTPFCDHALRLSEKDVVVIETSSFQLDNCFQFNPDIAVITNINENHLDRYQSYLDYAQAKYRIFQNQTKRDFLIYNADNPTLKERMENKSSPPTSSTRIPVSITEDLSIHYESCGYISNHDALAIKIKGETTYLSLKKKQIEDSPYLAGLHNLYNFFTASIASYLLTKSEVPIHNTLQQFKGIEHRMELVTTSRGVKYINDSKATSIGALQSALLASKRPIILISGGRDKGNDYKKTRPLIKEKVDILILIGESKKAFSEAFRGMTTIKEATSLEDAVSIASNLAKQGTTVLLSPGCSSFDMFPNGYEERGLAFKSYIQKIVHSS